jgi:hypothetical protein
MQGEKSKNLLNGEAAGEATAEA